MDAKMWITYIALWLCFMMQLLVETKEIVVAVNEQFSRMANLALTWSPEDTPVQLHVMAPINSTLSYDRSQEVYNYLETHGIHCYVGAHDPDIAPAAEKLGVFYITTLLNLQTNNVTLNMLPQPSELTGPLLDVMASYQWKTVGVLYEEMLASAVITNLVDYSSANLQFYKLNMFASENQIRKHVLEMRELDINKFLLLTRASVTRKVLTVARRLGVISKPYSWVILNLGSEDVATGILEDLRTNVTLVNFVQPDSVVQGKTGRLDQLGVAMMRDSFHAIEVAAGNMPMKAYGWDITAFRFELAVQLHQISFKGETGFVTFNHLGRRNNYTITLTVYNGNSVFPVGNWKSHPTIPEEKLTLKNMFPKVNITSSVHLKGKKAKVVSILEPPFFMWRKNPDMYKGNKRFKGFIVDMMEEISNMLEFDYEIYPVNDGNFGARLPNGEWNGMIGEVLCGNATMTAAPLSINVDREKVVDFTKPFKTRHIVVLLKTPESTSGYFQFMEPLAGMVWLCILGSIAIITICLFLLEKYSSSVTAVFPKLNAKESAWFIFGAIVGGGSETSPVTIPGRILTSAWWFFALIITSTYTANLAAFLTVKKINTPITSVGALTDQTKIIYGTVNNSGVMNFLKKTKIEPFKTMWTQMSEIFPTAMVNNTLEGVRRVKEGNYAFLWDSTVTSYHATTDCDVTEIGPPFDPKGFGLAVPPGATYLEELSLAVLKMSDSGKIMDFETKWWPTDICDDATKPSTGETTELTLDNVAGLFFVLICGLVLAICACLMDRAHTGIKHRQNKMKNNEETNHNDATELKYDLVKNHHKAAINNKPWEHRPGV